MTAYLGSADSQWCVLWSVRLVKVSCSLELQGDGGVHQRRLENHHSLELSVLTETNNRHMKNKNILLMFAKCSCILKAYCFTDCYLGVKLICRHWLQVVPWGCLDLSSPKSGVTLNTRGSFSFDSKHSERSDRDWQAIIIQPQLTHQSLIALNWF